MSILTRNDIDNLTIDNLASFDQIENPIDELLDQLRSDFNPLRFEYWIPPKNRVPYPTDKFDPRKRNTGKEILEQRPIHSIRKDIQRTLQDLLARINPTNSLKLGATLKLLDASVQTAALITKSQTTYYKCN